MKKIMLLTGLSSLLFSCQQAQEQVEYYASGEVKAITTWIDKEQNEELQIAFYKNGLVKDSTYYRNGKMHGTQVVYNDDHSKVEYFQYEAGVLNGTYFCKDFNREIVFGGVYDEGKAVGEFLFTNLAMNSVLLSKFYQDGKLVLSRKYITPDSSKLDEVFYLDILEYEIPSEEPFVAKERCLLKMVLPEITNGPLEVYVRSTGSDSVKMERGDDGFYTLPWVFEQPGEHTLTFAIEQVNPALDTLVLGNQSMTHTYQVVSPSDKNIK